MYIVEHLWPLAKPRKIYSNRSFVPSEVPATFAGLFEQRHGILEATSHTISDNVNVSFVL